MKKHSFLLIITLFISINVFGQILNKYGFVQKRTVHTIDSLNENEIDDLFICYFKTLQSKFEIGNPVLIPCFNIDKLLSINNLNIPIPTMDINKITYNNKTIPDSIYGYFKIYKIYLKDDNYTLMKNRIKKKKVYFIYLENIESNQDNNIVQNICLISEKSKRNLFHKKIHKGDTIKINIKSLFKKDCYNPNISNYLNEVDAKAIFVSNLFYNNIWYALIDCNYNYFISKSISGIYLNNK